jgi:hypothetical protein
MELMEFQKLKIQFMPSDADASVCMCAVCSSVNERRESKRHSYKLIDNVTDSVSNDKSGAAVVQEFEGVVCVNDGHEGGCWDSLIMVKIVKNSNLKFEKKLLKLKHSSATSLN